MSTDVVLFVSTARLDLRYKVTQPPATNGGTRSRTAYLIFRRISITRPNGLGPFHGQPDSIQKNVSYHFTKRIFQFVKYPVLRRSLIQFGKVRHMQLHFIKIKEGKFSISITSYHNIGKNVNEIYKDFGSFNSLRICRKLYFKIRPFDTLLIADMTMDGPRRPEKSITGRVE